MARKGTGPALTPAGGQTLVRFHYIQSYVDRKRKEEQEVKTEPARIRTPVYRSEAGRTIQAILRAH